MRLFCKHEYVYYYKDAEFWENLCRNHINACYYFACKHCGKVKKINQSEIKTQLKEYEESIKYLELMGKPLPDYKNLEYTLIPYCGMRESHRGRNVDATLRHYRRLGIDLTAIS